MIFFFFKQKTAYEMRISDWSSDVCSSDLEGEPRKTADACDRPAGAVVGEMLSGGVNLPWNLVLAAAVAASLLFTRLTFGAEGRMADADHLIGALALTVISIAAAEVARAARYLLIPLGAGLFVTPFLFDASGTQLAASLVAGTLLIALSLRRGPIRGRYGGWDAMIR